MVSTPTFVPLRHMIKADIVDDELSKYTTEKFLQISYVDNEASTDENDMILSSEHVSQVIEWTEMIKRLRQLYSESKSAIEAIGGHSNGKSLFDNSSKVGPISPQLTVKKVVTPSKKHGGSNNFKRLNFRGNK